MGYPTQKKKPCGEVGRTPLNDISFDKHTIVSEITSRLSAKAKKEEGEV